MGVARPPYTIPKIMILKRKRFSTSDDINSNEINSWGTKLEAEANRSIAQTMQSSASSTKMEIDRSIPKVDTKALQPLRAQKNQTHNISL